METFTWIYHTQSTEYPEGYTARLGNSYQYAPEPPSVDQRMIKLRFPTMFYFITSGGAIDTSKEPALNMALLDAFYKRHRMWKTFIYPHPVYGNMNVRFNKGLKIPAGIPGGNGALGGFDLEFLEQP